MPVMSDSDPDIFFRSVCQKIDTLVKSLRRLVRISVSREDEPVHGSQSVDVESCLSSLNPLLSVATNLSMSSMYAQVAPVVSSAYDLLRVVLKTLISVTRSQTLDQLLVEAVTLTVPLCLRFEPFVWETSEQEVSEYEILELIKSHIQEVPEAPAAQLLLQLLDCCLTLPHRHSCVRYTGLTADVTPDTDSNVSDLSVDSCLSTDDGYDADDELRNSRQKEDTKVLCDQWNLIRFPRLALTLLELLTGYQMAWSNKTTDQVLFKILDKMLTWCQECPRNSLILDGCGFPDFIVKSLRDLVSPSATPSDRIVRHFLSLFSAISRKRLHSSDLRSFLTLFKTGSQPPLKLLIEPLQEFCNQYHHRSPYTWISSDSTAVSGMGSRSEDRSEVRLRKSQCEKNSLTCCWTTALMAIPLPEYCLTSKSLTVSLWVKLNNSVTGKRSKQNNLCNGRCPHALHLMSLTSDTMSMEVWFCLKKKVLKYRLISFRSWNMTAESEEADPTPGTVMFPDKEWNHLCLTFLIEKDAFTRVRCCLNGDLRSLTCITDSSEMNPVSGKLFMLIGSSTPSPTTDISCVKLFTADADELDASLLYLMGPNNALLTLSHHSHILSEFPMDSSLVKYSLVRAFLMRNEKLSHLRSHVVAEFPLTSRSPVMMCLFSNERRATATQQGLNSLTYTVTISSPSPFLTPFAMRFDQDFVTALNDASGLMSQIFLFGLLVEKSCDAALQAEALQLLFSIVNVHPEFQRDFPLCHGYDMVNQVILSDSCIPSLALFEVYLKQCILFTEKGSFLRSSDCSRSLYRVWRKWHQLPDAASLIYSSLLSLIERKNCWWEYNLKHMRASGIMSEMKHMLETSFQEDSDQLSLNGRDVVTVAQIFRLLIGSPPEPLLISDLIHCLTLLHDSAKAYICQSKKNMYFLRLDGMIDERNSFANYSIASNEEWQLIRPVSHVSHETRHSIVFAELLNALNEVIADLLPQDVHSVLGPVITVNHFLIWSNSENGIIRESVLKTLLTTLKKPQAVNFVAEFLKKDGFHLISNQLTQYGVSSETLSSLITFILDADRINLCLEDWSLNRNWLKVTSSQASAFQAFMSLLLKSQENISLAHWSLQNLYKLLKSIPNSCHVLKYLHDNGLVICLVNVLCKSDTSVSRSNLLLDDDVIERDVLSLAEVLSAKLICSSGNIFREAFDDVVDFVLLQSLHQKHKSDVLRQFLIALLRTAFDSIEKHASDPVFSSQSSFKGELHLSATFLTMNCSLHESNTPFRFSTDFPA
jgi:hypothetical protein